LTDEQAGILLKGLLRYASTGEPLNSTDSALQAVFALFSAQIDRDTKKYEEKCRKNRENACKRYSNIHDGKQNNVTACDGMPTQANASISKSNITNKNNSNNNDDKAEAIIINGEFGISFDTIWELYEKPIGKKEFIEPLWNALSNDDKEVILNYIPLYVKSTPDTKYRKNLDNFLSERYWEDHPLIQNNNERNRNSKISGKENSRRNEVCSAAIEAINNLGSATAIPSLSIKHRPNVTKIPNMG
jgi:hypothetical protein